MNSMSIEQLGIAEAKRLGAKQWQGKQRPAFHSNRVELRGRAMQRKRIAMICSAKELRSAEMLRKKKPLSGWEPGQRQREMCD